MKREKLTRGISSSHSNRVQYGGKRFDSIKADDQYRRCLNLFEDARQEFDHSNVLKLNSVELSQASEKAKWDKFARNLSNSQSNALEEMVSGMQTAKT